MRTEQFKPLTLWTNTATKIKTMRLNNKPKTKIAWHKTKNSSRLNIKYKPMLEDTVSRTVQTGDALDQY